MRMFAELLSYEAERAALGVDGLIERRRATFLERCDCWLDTKAAVRSMLVRPLPSVKARFDASRWPPVARSPTQEQAQTTDCRVIDADTIDCAFSLIDREGLRPAVINLADDHMPGGCVDIGSGAQEESLFRRTALCGTLDLSMYPILDDEGIYSPDVAVLKASEADGWAPSQSPKTLSFLTVPGVSYPVCDYPADDLRHGKPRLKPVDATRLAVKVRMMLQLAHDHGHDSVVLGASGCGAWKCPPDHVAEVFAEVIAECPPGAFRVVAFAILRSPADGERQTGNFAAFTVGLRPHLR
jgi:uncharacterized protein (TIGR02452 family)